MNRRSLLKALLGVPGLVVLGGRVAGNSRDRFQPSAAPRVDSAATWTTGTSGGQIIWAEARINGKSAEPWRVVIL